MRRADQIALYAGALLMALSQLSMWEADWDKVFAFAMGLQIVPLVRLICDIWGTEADK